MPDQRFFFVRPTSIDSPRFRVVAYSSIAAYLCVARERFGKEAAAFAPEEVMEALLPNLFKRMAGAIYLELFDPINIRFTLDRMEVYEGDSYSPADDAYIATAEDEQEAAHLQEKVQELIIARLRADEDLRLRVGDERSLYFGTTRVK